MTKLKVLLEVEFELPEGCDAANEAQILAEDAVEDLGVDTAFVKSFTLIDEPITTAYEGN